MIENIRNSSSYLAIEDCLDTIVGYGCKSAILDEIKDHGHVLTPGRYVGDEAAKETDEPFEEKMSRLASTLEEHFDRSAELQTSISSSLRELKHDN